MLVSIPFFGQLNLAEEEKVKTLMTELKIPGMSLAIIKNSTIVYGKGFGKKDAFGKVTEKTLFQAASLSKFPAALLCLLNAQNKTIDIDQDINRYLKDHQLKGHKSAPKKIPSISQLLNHTGGLNIGGFLGYKKSKRKIPSIENVLDGKHTFLWEPKIKIKEKVNFQYRYSGGGYSYVQKMIEDFKGDSFKDVIKQELLLPLNMPSSSYELYQPEGADVALAHNKKGKSIKGGYRLYPQKAAAGLWTTSNEYAQLLLTILATLNNDDKAIFSKESISKLMTPTKTSNGRTNLYGLGVMLVLDNNENVKAILHTGRNFGYSTIFYLDVTNNSGYVILTNKHKTDFQKLRYFMAEYLEID